MHAGPEIGVAATKSFTSQLAILTLLGLLFGRMRNLSATDGSRVIEALEALPGQVEAVLELSDQIKEIAKRYVDANGMLFFGRQFNFPVALEGALKMKEITYLFAEGHPSAELTAASPPCHPQPGGRGVPAEAAPASTVPLAGR